MSGLDGGGSLVASPRIARGRFTHLDSYGVSLAQGAYARPRGLDSVYYGYSSRLAAMLALADPGEYDPVDVAATPYRNRASGGANLTWHSDGSSFARVLQDHQGTTTKQQDETLEAWPEGQRRVCSINSGVADLFNVAQGGDNDNPRLTIPKIAMAHALCISRFRAAFVKETEDRGALTQFAGTIYGNSGTDIRVATVEGQTAEYDFDALPEGAVVAIVGLHSNAWWSDWIINGEAFAASDYRPTQPDKISGWVYRIVVGEEREDRPYIEPDEPFTIECEADALSTYGVLDSIHIESPYRDRQPILVHGAVQWHSPTIAYFGASTEDRDDVFDELSATLETVCDLFAYGDENDVVFVPLEPEFGKQTDYFFPTFYGYDGIHWSDKAHQCVAQLDYEALASFVASRSA